MDSDGKEMFRDRDTLARNDRNCWMKNVTNSCAHSAHHMATLMACAISMHESTSELLLLCHHCSTRSNRSPESEPNKSVKLRFSLFVLFSFLFFHFFVALTQNCERKFCSPVDLYRATALCIWTRPHYIVTLDMHGMVRCARMKCCECCKRKRPIL